MARLSEHNLCYDGGGEEKKELPETNLIKTKANLVDKKCFKLFQITESIAG